MNNQALYYGNCIVFFGNTIQLLNSNFTNNSNIGSSLYSQNIINLGFGGVMYNAGITTIVTMCLFEGNSNKMGGVFSFSLNIATLKNKILITRSTFLINKADQFGGVIYFPPGFIQFECLCTNNLFMQNYANMSFLIFL